MSATVEQIRTHMEYRNGSSMPRFKDDFSGWFMDGAFDAVSNTDARLLMQWLINGEDKKVGDFMREQLVNAYGEKAEELARVNAEIARNDFFRSVANGSW